MDIEIEFVKLPVLVDTPLPHKPLSMDEYDEFIEHDLQFSFDRLAYEKEKALRRVNVPFILKDF